MQLGGPVWHVSVAPLAVAHISRFRLREIARKQLAGVGDAHLGQWDEFSPAGVLHVRRRLSADEQRLVGDVVDIRRTPEARRRAERLGSLLERLPPEIVAAEIGT